MRRSRIGLRRMHCMYVDYGVARRFLLILHVYYVWGLCECDFVWRIHVRDGKLMREPGWVQNGYKIWMNVSVEQKWVDLVFCLRRAWHFANAWMKSWTELSWVRSIVFYLLVASFDILSHQVTKVCYCPLRSCFKTPVFFKVPICFIIKSFVLFSTLTILTTASRTERVKY